ncbi:hypothetical protein [Clostridium tarantellae]|uniref:Uncharacterized protein n=1 Tax=Clostridium tarantellae TaxID=39493 RepID=A0A6I1MQN1_9CLOT|nr:hypothetical protein [Clostridium tarantellae]MPQ42609.1 hypothetical protein [Clostridium tarantellae]
MAKEKLKKILKSNIFVGGLCFALGIAVMQGEKGIDITKERYSQLLEMERIVLQRGKTKTEHAGKKFEGIGENKPFSSDDTAYLIDKKGVKVMSLAIKNAQLTEERNEFSDVYADKVVKIEYVYENIGINNNLYLHEHNFKVYDKEGNVLEFYPMDIDKHPQSISKGKKCTAEMFFALNNVCNDLEIEFYENPFNDKPNAIFKVMAK